jgi:hypothetical protein
MASKSVKLQRPGSGHRVQSLLKDMAAGIIHSQDSDRRSKSESVKTLSREE